MRLRLGLALMIAVSSVGNSTGLLAQDSLPTHSAGIEDVFHDAPDPSEHTGLLGKIYLQQRYDYLRVDDTDIRRLDKSIQGTDSVANLPVFTLNTALPLDFDVFFGYQNLGLKGSAQTGPPLDLTVGANWKIETFVVGTTIYQTMAEQFRPFVQVGANFSRSDADFFLGTDPLNMTAGNFVDHDTSLLLNVGFEADILDFLGYRMTLNLETKDRFQDSMLMNDLILWPHERIFARGGFATSLDGAGIGFTIGGGLAF